jgi:hypothetical protein
MNPGAGPLSRQRPDQPGVASRRAVDADNDQLLNPWHLPVPTIQIDNIIFRTIRCCCQERRGNRSTPPLDQRDRTPGQQRGQFPRSALSGLICPNVSMAGQVEGAGFFGGFGT